MIKHIVLFKLKEFNSIEEKKEALTKIKTGLESLINKIDLLQAIKVELNLEIESANYDLCLITQFKSVDDMNAYQIHPEHQKVLKYIKSVAAQRACVDFEI